MEAFDEINENLKSKYCVWSSDFEDGEYHIIVKLGKEFIKHGYTNPKNYFRFKQMYWVKPYNGFPIGYRCGLELSKAVFARFLVQARITELPSEGYLYVHFKKGGDRGYKPMKAIIYSSEEDIGDIIGTLNLKIQEEKKKDENK